MSNRILPLIFLSLGHITAKLHYMLPRDIIVNTRKTVLFAGLCERDLQFTIKITSKSGKNAVGNLNWWWLNSYHVV